MIGGAFCLQLLLPAKYTCCQRHEVYLPAVLFILLFLPLCNVLIYRTFTHLFWKHVPTFMKCGHHKQVSVEAGNNCP